MKKNIAIPFKAFTNEEHQCYVCRKEVSFGFKILERDLTEKCLCIMCHRKHMFEEIGEKK